MRIDPTVFVVDDDPSMCASLSRLLASAGYSVESYTDPEQFLTEYDPGRPGCLVLDVRLEGTTGLQVQQELTRRGASLPTLMISGYAETPVVVQSIKAGALDFLEKPLDDEVLVERVAEAMRRDALTRSDASDLDRALTAILRLSPRQRQAMRLLAAGKTTKQIAKMLGISAKTVDNHRQRVLSALDLDNVVELANLLNRLNETNPDTDPNFV